MNLLFIRPQVREGSSQSRQTVFVNHLTYNVAPTQKPMSDPTNVVGSNNDQKPQNLTKLKLVYKNQLQH